MSSRVNRRIGGKRFVSLESCCRHQTAVTYRLYCIQAVCIQYGTVLAVVVITWYVSSSIKNVWGSRWGGGGSLWSIHHRFFVGLGVYYTFEVRVTMSTLYNCWMIGKTLWFSLRLMTHTALCHETSGRLGLTGVRFPLQSLSSRD